MLESADATANEKKTGVERRKRRAGGGGEDGTSGGWGVHFPKKRGERILGGSVPQICRQSQASAWLHATLHTEEVGGGGRKRKRKGVSPATVNLMKNQKKEKRWWSKDVPPG